MCKVKSRYRKSSDRSIIVQSVQKLYQAILSVPCEKKNRITEKQESEGSKGSIHGVKNIQKS